MSEGLVNLEEILIAWNQLEQEEVQDVLRLWAIIRKMKDHGNAKLEIQVKDGIIVYAAETESWANRGGQPFSRCDLA